jgi:dihydroorotate dehydrogenase (NAD+) catalytic subunit
MDLRVKIGKLELDSPILCASGTFGISDELKGLVDYKNIGAVITKTLTLNPRAGNPPPRIYETECGVLNSVGLEGPGVDRFIKDHLPKLKKLPTKFIISIGAGSLDEYKKVLSKVAGQKEVEAVEINLSCPNIKDKKIVAQDPKSTLKTLKALRPITKKTLIAKISPEVTDIVEIAKAVKSSGIDALSLVNTFFGLAINIDTRKPYLGNGYGGYSGPAIRPLSLYRVWRVAKAVNIPIIGGGGIETAKDAIEFLLAGASAVSLGTINLVEPNAAKKILTGIKKYMKGKKITDIKKMTGSLDG